jgi:hypothetical protein
MTKWLILIQLTISATHAAILLIFVWNVATQQFVMIVKMGQTLNSLMGNASVLKVIGRIRIKHANCVRNQF